MPDRIILSMVLKSENGRDLCRLVKSHPEFGSIPVLLVSIGNKQHLVTDCFADGYIKKTFYYRRACADSELLYKA
jgi:CheY-like chemotaxis protein